MKPTDEALGLVHDWLADNGIASSHLEYSPAKDWIKISLPINAVENLLDTKYSVYAHEDGDYLVRSPSWSLPIHLHEHINVIQPTNSFFRPRQQASTAKTVEAIDEHHWKPMPPAPPLPTSPSLEAACNTSAVTPLCLRTLYGTIDYVPQVPGKNKVGLNDFLGESNNRSDTHLFLERYRPEAAPAAYTFDVVIIANGNNEQTQENATELAAGKDLEGNLDSETILGIAWYVFRIAQYRWHALISNSKAYTSHSLHNWRFSPIYSRPHNSHRHQRALPDLAQLRARTTVILTTTSNFNFLCRR